MSAVLEQQLNFLTDNEEGLWQRVLSKDPTSDGSFVFAVKTTGVYCRPSCPSRRPRRENVSFFPFPGAAERSGFRACLRCHPESAEVRDPQIQVAQKVCRLIENNEEENNWTLTSLSEKLGVSSFHLQRTFKNVMGVSPAQYAEGLRLTKFKSGVRQGLGIADAMYDAGYGSPSRLYENAASNLGMTPATYGKAGKGAKIGYGIADTALGRLLVAATEKGVCSVKLGDSDSQLIADLKTEFAAAEIRNAQKALGSWLQSVVDHLNHKAPHIDLPLDIRYTAFQRLVWEQLRAIPYGETLSYSDVAQSIGQPKAVRAVARACATNPVALVIPCHRVVREDKSLGGYRWGHDRKKQLLDGEKDVS